jgi:putative ABC transport system ATP-binding protein/lipoprotein-releasing system ATP-binding protein
MSSLDNPTSGSVEIDGHNVAKIKSRVLHALRNELIGFVFQFHYLLPELTSLENVLMPAIKTKRAKEKTALAKELLVRFGLGAKFGRLPRQLSGGEQQRVAIARALVMQPRFLFADEPTGNLDSINGETVMGILKEINAKQKTTIVLVTHEPDFAALAPRQVQLADGRVVSDTQEQKK